MCMRHVIHIHLAFPSRAHGEFVIPHFYFLAGVKKGILEAVEQIGRDAPAVFTAGMTGIEMMENAVFY